MAVALSVDNTITMADSIEHAKQLAEPYILKKQAVRIERISCPAPVHSWNYDYGEQDWIERLG